MPDDVQLAPHDALFKIVFSRAENAVGLLRSVLPRELVESIDWASVELRSGSFKDAHLGALESDLLFSARRGESRVLFYVLVEHQSTSDPRMAFRLWRYVTRVWERHPSGARLPLVIPVVVYHGNGAWRAARDIAELIDVKRSDPAARALLPRFTYLLDDLTALGVAELRARALPAFAALALWALRAASDRGFLQTVDLLGDVFRASVQNDGPEAVGIILRYLSYATAEADGAVDRVLSVLEPQQREDVMGFFDELIDKGRAEGRAEGQRSVVLKLLTLKFGPPTDAVRERVTGASSGELDRLAERILTAATLEDVFA